MNQDISTTPDTTTRNVDYHQYRTEPAKDNPDTETVSRSEMKHVASFQYLVPNLPVDKEYYLLSLKRIDRLLSESDWYSQPEPEPEPVESFYHALDLSGKVRISAGRSLMRGCSSGTYLGNDKPVPSSRESDQPTPIPHPIDQCITDPYPGGQRGPDPPSSINNGIYIITNEYHHRVYLQDPNDTTPVKGHFRPGNRNAPWHVRSRGDEQYSIENVEHNRHAESGNRAEVKVHVEGNGEERGDALQTRFGRLGSLAVLEDAISSHRQAVKLIPDNNHDEPGGFNSLGLALKIRFNCFGTLEDLENAISIQREAVNLTPNGHLNKPDRPIQALPTGEYPIATTDTENECAYRKFLHEGSNSVTTIPQTGTERYRARLASVLDRIRFMALGIAEDYQCHTAPSVPICGQPITTSKDVNTTTATDIHALEDAISMYMRWNILRAGRQACSQLDENTPSGDTDPPHLNGQVVIPDYRMPKFGRASLVYRGVWQDRQVAVKVLKARKCAGKTTNWERKMRREITLVTSTWAGLKHPNILPLFGYSDDFGDFGALISPWCERGTAQQYLAGRNLNHQKRARLALDVCEGVRYLHGASTIHGDIKPMNILVDDDGVARLCDFGLCRLVHQQELGDLTRTTVYDGPERYMAPEIFASVDVQRVTPTYEGDIYALGCITLEFIEGVYPFQRLSSNREVIDAILSRLPPALRCQSAHTSPTTMDALWNLLDTCWGEPSSRPSIVTVVECVAGLMNSEGAKGLSPIVTNGSSCRNIDFMGGQAGNVEERGLLYRSSAGSHVASAGRLWWKWIGRKKGKIVPTHVGASET